MFDIWALVGHTTTHNFGQKIETRILLH